MPSYAACRQRRSSVALGLAARAPRWNAIRHQNGSGPSRTALDDDESRPGTGACRDRGRDPVSKQTASCVFACVCVLHTHSSMPGCATATTAATMREDERCSKQTEEGPAQSLLLRPRTQFIRAITRASLTRASAVLGWPLC